MYINTYAYTFIHMYVYMIVPAPPTALSNIYILYIDLDIYKFLELNSRTSSSFRSLFLSLFLSHTRMPVLFPTHTLSFSCSHRFQVK